MSSLKKPSREQNSEYVAWIHGWKCLIEGCDKIRTQVQAHHTKTRGAGGSDMSCVPLCYRHHQQLHTIGVQTFQKRYGIDLEAEVRKYNDFYKKGLKGPHHDFVLLIGSQFFKPS